LPLSKTQPPPVLLVYAAQIGLYIFVLLYYDGFVVRILANILRVKEISVLSGHGR